MWGVLAFSFAVDGWVLMKTIGSVRKTQPPNVTFFQHCLKIRDPTTAAVLMEDGAACLGIVIAVAGIGATQTTGLALFDGLAGLGISGLMASMGIYLARLNQQYLLGQAVDPEITAGIKRILLARPSIEVVHSEQSQWIGPYAFSYKAEVHSIFYKIDARLSVNIYKYYWLANIRSILTAHFWQPSCCPGTRRNS